jgi:hypothetical protein
MTAGAFDMHKERILSLCRQPYAKGGWLGMPYEQNGCVKFLKLAFAEMGVDTGNDFTIFRDARRFKRVESPEFGDVAVFKSLPFASWHVAMMLDKRRAIQSCEATNGVGRIHLSRYPWNETDSLRGFYRLKCS